MWSRLLKILIRFVELGRYDARYFAEKPFKKNGVMSDVGQTGTDSAWNIKEMGLDCVVCIGGNGTQKTAAKLSAMG